MRVVLESVEGPHCGQKVMLHSGQTAKVGRTEWADFAFPRDGKMSSIHFALECDPNACRLRDLGSTNGTLVNDKKVSETILGDRDTVLAGETCFTVSIEDVAPVAPSAPLPSSSMPISPPDADLRSTLPDSRLQPAAPAVPSPAAETRVAPGEPAAPGVGTATLPQGALRVVLEAIGGPHAPQKTLLRAGQSTTVGRTERADLAFPLDSHLSALHFVIRCGDRTCRLRDLGSSNGTFVNGNRVFEAPLGDGDEICAGQSRFIVHLEGSAAFPLQETQVVATRKFDSGLDDEEASVRRQALLAAAWTRQPWLIAHCEKACDHPEPTNWEACMLLAILGNPRELPRIAALGRAEALGPRRFHALGAYGHPAVVESLLEAIGSEDAAAAAAAAAAFGKITGADIDSDRRARLPPEDGSPPDAGQQEFLDEALLPDPQRARAHWNEVKQQFSQSTRVCCGMDLSQGVTEEILAKLDMESRAEVCLRGKFQGTWRGSPRDLDGFPLEDKPPHPAGHVE